jgi:hypothetical protein
MTACCQCGGKLATRQERALGVCFQCYGQHASPSCRGGYCTHHQGRARAKQGWPVTVRREAPNA